ncbi:hypothetical protein, partial [Chryseobacterium balustinum]|uniref:hypothetical protein n=1 Tax=Chryseobacterium balustinum TaxID=246 RepID=UPI001E2A6B75
RFFFVAILKIFCCFTKVNKTAKGKATGGLVQQGFCVRRGVGCSLELCASVEICILVESFSFDLPTIAKPRNVTHNQRKKHV